MHLLSCCCVVQVGECVINKLGTVVVVVVVVVGLYADIHRESFILICIVGGSSPGMLIIQPLRAYALGCFNHPIVEGSCPGMLVIQRA